MIASFGDALADDVFNRRDSKRRRKFPPDVLSTAERKLDMVNAAVAIGDLRIPPQNRLERLKGDLAAYWSIRINAQWRVIFKWTPPNAYDVKVVDYH